MTMNGVIWGAFSYEMQVSEMQCRCSSNLLITSKVVATRHSLTAVRLYRTQPRKMQQQPICYQCSFTTGTTAPNYVSSAPPPCPASPAPPPPPRRFRCWRFRAALARPSTVLPLVMAFFTDKGLGPLTFLRLGLSFVGTWCLCVCAFVCVCVCVCV